MATFYFNGAINGNWATLGNWWTNAEHTISATGLPTSSDSAIATTSILTNSGSAPTVVNLTITNLAWFTIPITVTGTATFNDGSQNGGTITGNATFTDSANGNGDGGTVIGNATFNGQSYTGSGGTVTGNATFYGQSFVGDDGTVTGNATFYDQSFIDYGGTVTGSITVGGNREWQGSWWINNVQTTLRTSPGGVGLWNNSFYRNSVVYAGPSTIYVRTSGNDTNEGTESSPLASAQVAFEMAVGSSGNKMIDIGSGTFDGIILNQDWPSRIEIRGVNSTDSLLGGINGNGADVLVDMDTQEIIANPTDGYDINIISNKTINLGDISSIGGQNQPPISPAQYSGQGGSITLSDVECGSVASNGGGSYLGTTKDGGSIIISNSIVGSISSTGGTGEIGTVLPAGNGGSITLNNSFCYNIISSGGNNDVLETTASGGNAGNITITNNSVVNGYINANGGNSTGDSMGGDSSTITITNSTTLDITAIGGTGVGVNFILGSGNSGTVTLTNSTCGEITVNSTNTDDASAGSAGIVSLTNSTCQNILANGGIGNPPSSGGTVTLLNSAANIIEVDGSYSDYAGNGSSAGTVSLTNSSCFQIDGNGGDGGTGGNLSVGATIDLINSTCTIVNVAGGSGVDKAVGGTVALSGSSIIPNTINNASVVNTSNLNKGRGINGSNILGLV